MKSLAVTVLQHVTNTKLLQESSFINFLGSYSTIMYPKQLFTYDLVQEVCEKINANLQNLCSNLKNKKVTHSNPYLVCNCQNIEITELTGLWNHNNFKFLCYVRKFLVISKFIGNSSCYKIMEKHYLFVPFLFMVVVIAIAVSSYEPIFKPQALTQPIYYIIRSIFKWKCCFQVLNKT